MANSKITDRKMKNGLSIIVVIARILIGGILIYASVNKIADPGGFARAIDNYHLIPLDRKSVV